MMFLPVLKLIMIVNHACNCEYIRSVFCAVEVRSRRDDTAMGDSPPTELDRELQSLVEAPAESMLSSWSSAG